MLRSISGRGEWVEQAEVNMGFKPSELIFFCLVFVLSMPAAGEKKDNDQYFPFSEKLGENEMRVISLGTGMPGFSKGQAAASFLVQLGNGENFIFDMGTNALGNLVALQIPFNSLDKVFLGHLHFDHMGDLSALLISGVSLGRNIPLKVWGPSGKTPEMGTRYAVDRLMEAYSWEFASKKGRVPSTGYQAIVTEFDYSKVQTVYQENGITIKSWPAIHTIDGPVSFSLEWNGLKFVYSSDTYPNKWFYENAMNADILIHEAFPTVSQLVTYYNMKPESAWPVGTRVHTQPAAAGKVFSQTRPRMAIAYHFIYEVRTYDEVFSEIRTAYDGPLTLARDLLVWNVTKDEITVREAVLPDITWPSKSKKQNAKIELDKRVFASQWIEDGRLDMDAVDQAILNRLAPPVRERIIEKFPELKN
jgi:ribonuclease Z